MTMRPVPGDTSAEHVQALIDADDTYLLTAAGDYQSAAVEAFQNDGSRYRRGILVQWPTRRNKTDEHVDVRLFMSPEDAMGLAQVLAQSARWLMLHRSMEG